MNIRFFEEDGVMIYEVDGEINIDSSPQFKKFFERQPSAKIIIDLERVGYIDSSGLATLVDLLKKTKSKGGSLGLSGLSERVKSLFEITKLDKLFLIYSSRLDALLEIK